MDKDTTSNADKSVNRKKLKKTAVEDTPSTSGNSSHHLMTPEDSNYSLNRAESPISSKDKVTNSVEDDSASWVPLSKGHEQYNIIKPSTSMRPVSPPPPRNILAKINKQMTVSLEKNKPQGSSEDREDKNDIVASDKQTFANTNNTPPSLSIIFDYNFPYDDEDEDEEFIFYNTSGSVLKPVSNPYNKQERIRQANIDLFKEDMSATLDGPKIKFNECVYLLGSHTSLHSIESSGSGEPDTEKEIASVSADNEATSSSCCKEYSDRETHRKDDAKNGVPDGLKVKGANPKVLLVMVPNASRDLIGLHSDNSSSSENEDVCIGHSIITSDQIGHENDTGFSEVMVSLDQTKHENYYDEKEEEIIQEVIGGTGDGIGTEELDGNQNFLDAFKSDLFCDNNGGGDSCYVTENNTGIQIKITCPNCSDILNCVEFCSSENENNLCCTDYETCVQAPHSCNKALKDTENILSQCDTNTILKQKNCIGDKKFDLSHYTNGSTKPENMISKKTTPVIKNTFTNTISINLKSKNNHNSSLKANFFLKTESNLDQRKNCNKNKSAKKRDSCDENNSSEKFSQKKQTNQIKNKTRINASSVENDKENEKQLNSNNKFFKKPYDKSSELQECHSVEKCNIKKGNNYSKQKIRPKSCPEHHSKKQYHITRPVTAPLSMKRGCCAVDPSRLPDYNGFRSEYGLSEEQLQERRRLKSEKIKMRKLKRQEKIAEDERKRKENEETFMAWLAKKNEQAKKKRTQNHSYPGYTFRRFSAPASRMMKSNTFLKIPDSKLGRPLSIDKFLNDATPQEKKTYRIYLGLGTE